MGTILIHRSVITPDTALPLFSDIFPGVPDPRPSEPLFSDSLVRPTDTDISTIPGWHQLRGAGFPVLMTPLGTVSGAAGTAHAGYESGTANVDIRATIDRSVITGANFIGLILRASNTTGWNSCIRITASTNTLRVQRIDGGTTTIAQGALPVGATGPHSIRVTAAGPQFRVYFDQVEVLQFSEAFNQSATVHGIMADSSGETHFRDLEIRPYTG